MPRNDDLIGGVLGSEVIGRNPISIGIQDSDGKSPRSVPVILLELEINGGPMDANSKAQPITFNGYTGKDNAHRFVMGYFIRQKGIGEIRLYCERR